VWRSVDVDACGTPREQWALKSPTELLDLKICDPAMGSGAFLVQACRWLSDRLVEAWSQVEATGKTVSVDSEVLEAGAAKEPLPRDSEARTVIARRLIAERCLYGVDLNPLAVELAKLSIWLVTLAKGRPFGFLDHNLRCGDSLLGIHRLDQLTELSMAPTGKGQQRLFGRNIEQAVGEAIELRQRLREMPIRDIHDIEVMARLDADARRKLDVPESVADAFIGEVLVAGSSASALGGALASLAIQAGQAIAADQVAFGDIARRTGHALSADLPVGKSARRPFHWPLEFPEVFSRVTPGFDALIGNPPFLGNRLWRGALGEKFQWQCQMVLGKSPGKVDLCVVFHRRAVDLLRKDGCYGLLSTSNVAEGSAIDVGLGIVVKSGNIYFARKGMPWPGAAAVVVAIVGFFKGRWRGSCDADGSKCVRIGPRLEPESVNVWEPKPLSDAPFAFEGVNNSKGLAFLISSSSSWFQILTQERDSLLRPYITGDDITSSALNHIQRWALDIEGRNLDEIALRWPQAARFLVEVVKPTRTPEALKSYKGLIDRWWQFPRHRSELMKRLRQCMNFIAYSKNTKYPVGMLAPSKWIYTNKVLLIGMERDDLFAISLSTGFRMWMEKFCGGSLGETLTLSISESVDKYPIPQAMVSMLGIDAALRFNDLAIAYSAENECGLTDVMNAVNTPSNDEAVIIELRRLMSVIDVQVLAAYGWDDIEIAYDFREFEGGSTNDPWRWAPVKDVTSDILRRLTTLNRERFEVNAIGGDPYAGTTSKRGRRTQATTVVAQGGLFDEALQ